MTDLFTYATRLRDTGMAVAADAQDRTIRNWSVLAYMAVCAVADRQATVHVDDVVKSFPYQPAHPNAWGHVWMRAIKNGVIERTGQLRRSTDPKKHAHSYPVYSSRMFKGSAS